MNSALRSLEETRNLVDEFYRTYRIDREALRGIEGLDEHLALLREQETLDSLRKEGIQ